MPNPLPPAGSQRTLALAQLSNSLGDSAYYVTSALYFTHVVGLAPARIGLGLTVAWAVGSVVGVPSAGSRTAGARAEQRSCSPSRPAPRSPPSWPYAISSRSS